MVPSQRARAMEAALDNVIRFLRGETPRNIVDPTDYPKAGSKDLSHGSVRGV